MVVKVARKAEAGQHKHLGDGAIPLGDGVADLAPRSRSARGRGVWALYSLYQQMWEDRRGRRVGSPTLCV